MQKLAFVALFIIPSYNTNNNNIAPVCLTIGPTSSPKSVIDRWVELHGRPRLGQVAVSDLPIDVPSTPPQRLRSTILTFASHVQSRFGVGQMDKRRMQPTLYFVSAVLIELSCMHTDRLARAGPCARRAPSHFTLNS